MKKILVIVSLMLTLSLLLCACSKKPEDSPEETEEASTETPGLSGMVGAFFTQNVRVSGSLGQWDKDATPRVRLFSSYKQYETYQENNFQDQEVQVPGSVDVFGEEFAYFPDLLEKYNEEFFEDTYLVLIQIYEESDTVRHRVEWLEIRDVKGESKLCIDIKRLTQPMDNPVGAYWYVFVELDRTDLVLGAASQIHVEMEG